MNLYDVFGFPKVETARGLLVCQVIKLNSVGIKNRRRPAVLIIPDGAYSEPSEREAEPVALYFLTRGYAAFTLYYSCKPHGFPAALREAAMAMRYIRENADEFGLSFDMVAAIGFSAGGHLCGMLGTMYDCPEVADIAESAVIRPDALGLCYPVLVEWDCAHECTFQNISMGDSELRKRLSIDRHVRSDMPPVFLWYTRTDASVSCRDSIIMADALEKASVDFALHIYRKGPHGLSTADNLIYTSGKVPEISQDVRSWVSAMMEFFEDVGFRTEDIQ